MIAPPLVRPAGPSTSTGAAKSCSSTPSNIGTRTRSGFAADATGAPTASAPTPPTDSAEARGKARRPTMTSSKSGSPHGSGGVPRRFPGAGGGVRSGRAG